MMDIYDTFQLNFNNKYNLKTFHENVNALFVKKENEN